MHSRDRRTPLCCRSVLSLALLTSLASLSCYSLAETTHQQPQTLHNGVETFSYRRLLQTLIAVPKIAGGVDAIAGEFPYAVSVRLKNALFHIGTHFCGGVLIDKEWVLTAAHCVDARTIQAQPDPLVYVGGLSLDGHDSEKIQVVETVMHHQWNGNSASGADLALLRLERPSNRQPAVLTSVNMENLYPGKALTAIGWGRTLPRGQFASTLKKTDNLPYIELSLCESALGMNMKSTLLCAGDGSSDTCQGDSGGPLLDQDSTLVGIASFGAVDCGSPGKPGVYVRVSAFLDWIQKRGRTFVDGAPNVTNTNPGPIDSPNGGASSPEQDGNTNATTPSSKQEDRSNVTAIAPEREDLVNGNATTPERDDSSNVTSTSQEQDGALNIPATTSGPTTVQLRRADVDVQDLVEGSSSKGKKGKKKNKKKEKKDKRTKKTKEKKEQQEMNGRTTDVDDDEATNGDASQGKKNPTDAPESSSQDVSIGKDLTPTNGESDVSQERNITQSRSSSPDSGEPTNGDAPNAKLSRLADKYPCPAKVQCVDTQQVTRTDGETVTVTTCKCVAWVQDGSCHQDGWTKIGGVGKCNGG